MDKDFTASFTHTYDMRIIIDNSKELTRIHELGLEKYERIIIIVDETVFGLYGNMLMGRMEVFGRDLLVHKVTPVEHTKSIEYYPKLIEFLELNTVGRYDAVVAIGGGICLDLASFAVSTYMRGLPFFMIPTTLIGETDASTAGKTCLNSFDSKNLLGTFYYPKVIYNSIEILRSCSKRITRQGLSEAFKYSLLTDGAIIPDIIKFQNDMFDVKLLEKIVRKTIESRIAIRQVDPLASNLGHTFGHALEKYTNYLVLHGDAILTGTVMAIHYAVEKGLMSSEEKLEIFKLMRESRLNVWIPDDLDVHLLVDYMRKDKKSSSKKLHLVLINGIGKPYRGETPFYEADYEDVEEFLIRYTDNYRYKKANYALFLEQEVLE